MKSDYSRVIGVKVFVDVHDKTSLRAVRVSDLVQSISRTVGDESLSGGPVVARKQNQLGLSALDRISISMAS